MECVCGRCAWEKYDRVVPAYEYSVPDQDRQKAGMFLYDDSGLVLLVQCWGEHWGPPKGTIEFGETALDCAIREVKEETGLEFDKETVETSPSHALNNVTLYFVKMDRVHWRSDNIYKGEDNDATSVGTFSPRCIENAARRNAIQLNSVYKFGIKHYRRLH